MNSIAIDSTKYALVAPTGSTNWKQILVSAAATPGVELHTPPNVDDTIDVVDIDAQNISAGAVVLTLEIGGVAAGNQEVVSIPSRAEPTMVMSGRVLSPGDKVAAFAASANVVNVNVTVRRYSKVN